MSDDDGYQLGTPVVAGSDNWTVELPPCCKDRLYRVELDVDENNFYFSGGTLIGTSGFICVNAGIRIKLTSRAQSDVYITATQKIFNFSSTILSPGKNMFFSTSHAAIVQGGTLTVRVGQSNPSPAATLDVTLCPEPGPFRSLDC
jgi:hypothetical protein